MAGRSSPPGELAPGTVSRFGRLAGFGLRGQIVGAVLVTTVVTLSVAAIVLLPQLEQSLRAASKQSLDSELHKSAAEAEIRKLAGVDYAYLPVLGLPRDQLASIRGTSTYRKAVAASHALGTNIHQLSQQLGAPEVTLIGYVDASGHGYVINGFGAAASPAASGPGDDLGDVRVVTLQGRPDFEPYLSFGTLAGTQDVRAAVRLPDDAVLAVRKSIDEIPTAAKAVARAFEVAALAGLLLTGLLAIPLAATLARRLQRLREAAQRVAEEGAGAVMPTDRSHDEVGDLARSFAIMQRRLAQQEEARRAFVATASHELRTPLASLEGMLELVADDLSAPDPNLGEANALLGRARAQSRRLSRLAADLLDLSRIDAAVPLRSEPVELVELARAVLAEFDLASQRREVGTRLETDAAGVWVRADPGKVAQILRILLDNALRVAPSGTHVTVSLLSDGLLVRDTGPGVASEERDRIFERFKRGQATGGEAGFGLGLAIGRELARRMDGDLTLESAGAGATFRLTLPEAGESAANGRDQPVGTGS